MARTPLILSETSCDGCAVLIALVLSSLLIPGEYRDQFCNLMLSFFVCQVAESNSAIPLNPSERSPNDRSRDLAITDSDSRITKIARR